MIGNFLQDLGFIHFTREDLAGGVYWFISFKVFNFIFAIKSLIYFIMAVDFITSTFASASTCSFIDASVLINFASFKSNKVVIKVFNHL